MEQDEVYSIMVPGKEYHVRDVVDLLHPGEELPSSSSKYIQISRCLLNLYKRDRVEKYFMPDNKRYCIYKRC